MFLTTFAVFMGDSIGVEYGVSAVVFIVRAVEKYEVKVSNSSRSGVLKKMEIEAMKMVVMMKKSFIYRY